MTSEPRARDTHCPTCGHPLRQPGINPYMPTDQPRSGTVYSCRACGQRWGHMAYPPRHPQAPPWLLAVMQHWGIPDD